MSLPLLEQYLESLPRGLDSYPECKAKCSLLRSVLQQNQHPIDYEGVPALLRELMQDPPAQSSWVSEVHFVAMHSVLVDRGGHDVVSVQEVAFRANRSLTESRMYTALTKVASPTMLLRSAALTWRVIHRGTKLDVAGAPGRATLTLTHPPYLYGETAHQSAARGFTAVLEACGADEIVHEVADSQPTRLVAQLSWAA